MKVNKAYIKKAMNKYNSVYKRKIAKILWMRMKRVLINKFSIKYYSALANNSNSYFLIKNFRLIHLTKFNSCLKDQINEKIKQKIFSN